MSEENIEGTNGTADSTTDTASDVVNDEDRLRQEAAKRLERRRRKMMSPEERLAKITGRPVSSSSPLGEEAPSSLTGKKLFFICIVKSVSLPCISISRNYQ